MNTWIDGCCILIVLFALIMLTTYRITGMIRLYTIQTFLLSLVPLFLHADSISGHEWFLSLATMVLKAGVVPYVLFWAIRHISIRSEVKPFFGAGVSILCGVMIIAGAFWMSLSLKLPGHLSNGLIMPCSMAIILLGFMMMVTRTRAITQVVGYLVIENGIFLFALSLFDAMPALIEMGIFLDIFVAVFIMAIVLNHINEEFDQAGPGSELSKLGESF